VITLSNVTKKYGNGHIGLNNISLQIATGEMVFLQGHSGAGKSTLLKLIALLERPSSGQIIVTNKNINHIPAAQIPFYCLIMRRFLIMWRSHSLY
jgi:cell division transport system ATP-binding protein